MYYEKLSIENNSTECLYNIARLFLFYAFIENDKNVTNFSESSLCLDNLAINSSLNNKYIKISCLIVFKDILISRMLLFFKFISEINYMANLVRLQSFLVSGIN